MKKISILLVLFILFSQSCIIFNASADITDDLTLNVEKSSTAPDIDGIIDTQEWGQPVLHYIKSDSSTTKNWTVDNNPASADDIAVYLKWDSTHLYIGTVVHDTTHYNKQSVGENIWNGSAFHIQLSFNKDHFTTDKYRITYGINDSGEGCGWVYRQPSGINGSTSFMNVSLAVPGQCGIAREDGYTTYEISYAWSDINPGGSNLAAGDSFYFRPMYYFADGTTADDGSYVIAGAEWDSYTDFDDTFSFQYGLVKLTDSNAAIENAISLIDDIGISPIEDPDNMFKARAAYDALTEQQKALVSNYATLTAAEAEYYAALVYGDVNDDGDVTAADALMALQYSVKKITFSDKQILLADVDNTVGVTASDALLILQYSVIKITSFPIQNVG